MVFPLVSLLFRNFLLCLLALPFFLGHGVDSRCNVSSKGRVRVRRVLDVYLAVTYYYIVTMRKKESCVSMMVVTVDMDQESIPS